jgi:hypothetical protein
VGDIQIVLQPLGLCPFSSTGRTEEDNAHGRRGVGCRVSGVSLDV